MKKFFEVLPDLKLNSNLTEIFEDAECERVVSSKDRSRIKIIFHSSRIIGYKSIRKVEEAISAQMFDGRIGVKLEPRFELSKRYTPEVILDEYSESLCEEMGAQGHILSDLFSRSDKYFSDDRSELVIESNDNEILRSRMDSLKCFLESVFSDRFGIDIKVRAKWITGRGTGDIPSSSDSENEEISRILDDYEQARGKLSQEQGSTVSSDTPANSGNGYRKNTIRQKAPADPGIFYGKSFDGEPVPLEEIEGDIGEVIVRGQIRDVETREIRNEKTLIILTITDFTDSIRAKIFVKNESLPELLDRLKPGEFIKMKASASMDSYDREICLGSVAGISRIPDFREKRTDNSPVKRVELHCHTNMSEMDGIADVTKILETLTSWGHKAAAITDHGVVQSFPDAYHYAGKSDFKVIYGMEGYLVDDAKQIVTDSKGQKLDGTFVVFDIETTGFSAAHDSIIEIGAVKVLGGNITDYFSEFVDPKRPIPARIVKLTGITDSMVEKADTIETVLGRFVEFCSGSVLVAHNADFDMGFIHENCRRLGIVSDFTYVDTLGIARSFLEGLKNYKLDTIAESMGIALENHHRAVDDAQATAEIFIRFLARFRGRGISDLDELNTYSAMSPEAVRKLKPYHIIILAKNEIGRVNLYRLVSMSHMDYYSRVPKIPKTELIKHREGLIIGSACSSGELFGAVLEDRSDEEIARIVEFYDYLEIQPTGNNEFMIRDPKSDVSSVKDLEEISKRIVSLGEEFDKPVCATGDVHFINPEDEIYRRIIMTYKGFSDADIQAPLYLRTTQEMLDEFSYLGEKKAYEVVVTNTNLIADMIEYISPVRPDKCPPVIEDSDSTLREICYSRAHELYGEELPEIVADRLDRELTSIIGNGYAVMYIIAQKLVWKSLEDGYLVGSRGSVGSSFVAYLSGITEVNSLHAHYLCPNCHYVDFDSDYVKSFSRMSGCDMEDRICPVCGTPLSKEGHDIPFETFLGFEGNKEPDIDLNFSGDYQTKAHAYTEVIFGKGNTFRAGTIGTVADKTAYGYVMHYFEDHGQRKRSCEIERIASGCVGVRRTTGQHPGGIMVLPYGEDINTFTPVQHPANDQSSDIVTTHFNYHSIDHNLLKLDILGHENPTMIRMMEDITGIDARTIRMDDPDSLSLFQGLDALKITPEEIGGITLGSLGIPEFGTDLVMQMLKETKPKTFSDLVRISGLSHGTGVWNGNAQTLIRDGKADITTAICTRDDIMLYLIGKGMDSEQSFKIMESVRKGKGLTPAQEQAMTEHGVPEWYLWSCSQIQYMFPKAHAVAYVMMGMRIAWYKINAPLAYYSAYFTIKATAFDYELMCQGKAAVDRNVETYKNIAHPSKKEQDILRDLRVTQEFYARGFEFVKIDLYKSDAVRFKIADGKLLPPFSVIDGMGATAAEALAVAAQGEPFLSKDDIKQRGKVSQTVLDTMDQMELLGDLPESNQMSIFDIL